MLMWVVQEGDHKHISYDYLDLSEHFHILYFTKGASYDIELDEYDLFSFVINLHNIFCLNNSEYA